MKRDVQTEVTERILQELERGCLPWIKPWASTAGANVPCNAITNRPYSGTNTVLLWIALRRGWPTPRFLTFKQAKEAGGFVKKGERGNEIVFMKRIVVKDKKNPDETKMIGLLRGWTVFNVAQCEGLSDAIVNGKPMRIRNPDTRDELADDFVKATGAVVREGAGEAFYVPSADFISMPAFAAFKSADTFYNTMFHELTHWTAPKKRCDRDLTTRFGTDRYAVEELVAELGAAFMAAEFGFDGEVRNAGYIKHWIAILKNNKQAFFTAASKAQQAVDFLRSKILEETATTTETDSVDVDDTVELVAA